MLYRITYLACFTIAIVMGLCTVHLGLTSVYGAGYLHFAMVSVLTGVAGVSGVKLVSST
jgi:uncharacterized paraquat-inducible protein A